MADFSHNRHDSSIAIPYSQNHECHTTLRYLWDNSGVIDLLYHHLHFENIAQYVNDEETSAKVGD